MFPGLAVLREMSREINRHLEMSPRLIVVGPPRREASIQPFE